VTANLSASASLAAFERGAVDLIEKRELVARLAQAETSGQPLRLKFGMDPSSPDLHLGHAIPLFKLRQLQRLGHKVVIIVGDATAMVGDPSGRNKLRPQLSRAEVESNLVTYVDQVGRVLDMRLTEVRRNSEWFDRFDFAALLKLAGRMTVARMLERDTFEQRMEKGEPIGIHEFLYPLLQGWDSVEVRADVEFGGTDQLYNLLVGRQFQEQEGQRPQVCLTTPLINGADGRKMSKSYGNAIPLTAEPADMFGKIMALPDEVLGTWFELLTEASAEEIADRLKEHPRAAKARLAREVVANLNGAEQGRLANEAFDRQFKQKELPSDIPKLEYPRPWPAEGVPLAVLLRELGLVASSSDARRLISQGGVRLDNEVQKDPNLRLSRPAAPLLIQVGKLRFARLHAR
jgi:tyrosyl-tRNA synthetase